MKKADVQLYKKKANVFKAISHPSRLIIIDLLKNSEKTVSEIQKVIGDDISTISKHLLVLHNAGIVLKRREAKNIYYSLRFVCIMNFLECIEEFLLAESTENHEIMQKCCSIKSSKRFAGR